MTENDVTYSQSSQVSPIFLNIRIFIMRAQRILTNTKRNIKMSIDFKCAIDGFLMLIFFKFGGQKRRNLHSHFGYTVQSLSTVELPHAAQYPFRFLPGICRQVQEAFRIRASVG